MSRLSSRLADPRVDVWVGAAASAAIGVAAFMGLGSLSAGSLPLAVAAGAVGGSAFTLLLTAGWVEPLGLLAVSLPLPAIASSADARLSPALMVGAVIVFAWVLGRGLDERPATIRLRTVAPLGCLVAAVLVSALFAEARVTAAREVVTFLLFLALMVVIIDQVRARRTRAEAVVTWMVVVAALAGAWAVAEMSGFASGRFPLPGSGLYRATGGFGWPNELGMFLAIAFPLAVHRMTRARGWSRLTWGVAAGLVAFGLGATFSRGSWLSVALAPAVLFLVGEGRLALRFWAGGLLLAAVVNLVTGGAIIARIVGTTGDVLVGQRLLLSAAGLLMFRAHPMVGVGPGGFGDALERFGPQISGLFDFVGSAHNGYVHIAAEAGILGLAGMIAFLGVTWWRVLLTARRAGARSGDRRLNVSLLWSFTTVGLVSLFEWPFAHGVGESILLVAGVGLALADADREAA